MVVFIFLVSSSYTTIYIHVLVCEMHFLCYDYSHVNDCGCGQNQIMLKIDGSIQHPTQVPHRDAQTLQIIQHKIKRNYVFTYTFNLSPMF